MKPDLKFTFPESIWAGSNNSLSIAEEFYNALRAGVYDNREAEPVDPSPYNFTMQGNIGIVTIAGALVNEDSPWNKYRGVTSYADVRRAMIYAANQANVEAILLDINSGGGAVSGVADTADLITTIDKSLKPVYAFTDGAMMSAAYWLGVSARAVYVSKTAEVGSVGVIATHKEYSKAFKEAGIGVTVLRAGEFKALTNSMEPLTDVAKARLQSQLEAAYKVFAEHCASRLGVSMDVFEASMGQGRDFFGEQAVSAGLAKGLKTLDSMLSLIEAKQIDINRKKGNTAGNYQQGVNMTRQALTETQLAALAAGGVVLDAAAAAALAAEQAAAATAAAAALAATQTPEAVAAAALAAAAAAAPAAVTQPANENLVLVDFLKAQIATKDAAFVAQSVELTNLKSKVSGMEATHAGLVKIAAQSVSHMKVAMGLSKVELSAMDPALLLAEHAATATAFTEKFKVGGVAAVSATENTETQAGVSHEIAARVQANRVTARK